MDLNALSTALKAVCPGFVSIDFDPTTGALSAPQFDGTATAAQEQAAQQIIATWSDPVPPRVAPLSALLDPLSPAQRASITADHMQRLQAEVQTHPGGLPVGNAKVARAAADLGMAPEAWYTMAGY